MALSRDLRRPVPSSERLFATVLFACAFVSVVTTVGIVLVLVFETIEFFQEVSFLEFFGSIEWTPLFAEKHFGIWPLVAGTFLTSVIAILIALPLGILAAVNLSEFMKAGMRDIVKPVLELLAGIPTVVYGYFALMIITPVLQTFIPGLSGFNALSAGIVMGIMIFPIIASLSEDAIFSVPQNIREGAYALGGSRFTSLTKVIIPAAFSGIAASIVLGVSRAIGETMIVAIAAGQQARLSFDPRLAIETMTAYIVQVSLGDTPTGTLEYKTIFAVGAALFVLTLALNIIAHRLRQKLREGVKTA